MGAVREAFQRFRFGMRGRKFAFSTVSRQGYLARSTSVPRSRSRSAVMVCAAVSTSTIFAVEEIWLAPKRSASCEPICPVAPSSDSLPQKMRSNSPSSFAALAMT